MDNVSQFIEQLFQFQYSFSTIAIKLQEEGNKYNNAYNQAINKLRIYFQELQQITKKLNLKQNDNQLKQFEIPQDYLQSVEQHFNELTEQYNIFNQNILQYQLQKFEFDKFYQEIQLEKMVDRQQRRFYNLNLPESSSINCEQIRQFPIQQQSIVQKQNLQFKLNEQFMNFISQKTTIMQEETQIRERKKKEIFDKMEEQKRIQEEIKRQQEELQQKHANDTNNEQKIKENNNYDDDCLSEAEDLTQQCQECGQQIQFNHFLTKCLHYYHEECIIQKIKANYQQTSIYCTCNTLISSRMIKDALKNLQKDQDQFNYETYLHNQVEQLVSQSNMKYTKCQCGFFFISEIQQIIQTCTNCE